MTNGNREDPRRVMHIIGQLVSGGVEHRTLDLIEHSKNSGIEHHVCLTSGKKGILDTEYQKHGAHLHYLKFHSVLFWFKFIFLIRREKIDVVHSNIHHMSGAIMALAWLAGTKSRITHFRSDGDKIEENFIRKLRTFFLKILIQTYSTNIIGLTPENLKLAWKTNWQADDRCIVIPNGVIVPPLDTAIDPSMVEFEGKTVILHAGRANLPTKNREKAITVFGEYTKLNPNAVLVFVGRNGNDENQASSQLQKWRKIASDLGIEDRVFFLDQQNNMPGIYYGADVLLFTSTKEGLPGVVLEALASGLPVVSSNVPGSLYIASTCENVSIHDPNHSDISWANDLHSLEMKLTPSARAGNVSQFQKSGFTIKNAVQNYTNLWKS